jgi:MerR family transcriptional regulator, heat shock protein HspR
VVPSLRMTSRSAFDPDDDTPVFVISVAAELAGMHAQTLRQYDRLGLVTPSRTRGGGRRYSSRDVSLLREVQRLSQEGVSLPGIARILELEQRVGELEDRLAEAAAELRAARAPHTHRIFSVSPSGDVYATRLGERPRGRDSRALVLWEPLNRRMR